MAKLGTGGCPLPAAAIRLGMPCLNHCSSPREKKDRLSDGEEKEKVNLVLEQGEEEAGGGGDRQWTAPARLPPACHGARSRCNVTADTWI